MTGERYLRYLRFAAEALPLHPPTRMAVHFHGAVFGAMPTRTKTMLPTAAAVVATALTVIAGASSASAAQPTKSLTDFEELWWMSASAQRIAPAEPFCLPRTPYLYLLIDDNNEPNATNVRATTTCHLAANTPVVIPVVTTVDGVVDSENTEIFLAEHMFFPSAAVSAATNLSFSINGRSEPVTVDWRAPSPFFHISAAEGMRPSLIVADGYWTVRSFPAGVHVVHTTGCIIASRGAAQTCHDITYQLIVR